MAQNARAKRKRRRTSATSTARATDGAGATGATGAAGAAVETVDTSVLPRQARRSAQDIAERPTVDLERERRFGRLAGAAAVGSALLSLVAVPVAASGPHIGASVGSNKYLLLQIAGSSGAQLDVAWIRVAAALLTIGLVLFLYGAIKGRDPTHQRWLPVLGVVGLVVFAGSLPAVFFELRHAAHLFVASGPRTYARADHLVTAQRDKGPLQIAEIARLAGAAMTGIWLAMASYDSQKVGLLTKFLGIFGVAGGLLTVVGISVAQDLVLAWVACVGILALGRWPGGRPPAWEAGRAISWDSEEGARHR
ncbi:MAG: hypothetical protein ACYDHH_17055 [Solirubrobacteraceae bacterium]